VAGLSLSLLLVVGLVTWVVLDDDTYVAPPPPVAGRQAAPSLAAAALHRLERAVGARDPRRAMDLAPGSDDDARALLDALVDNARDARVEEFSLRYVDETGPVREDGTWTAAVDTTWAFRGFDDAPARSEVSFTFVQEGDEVRVAGIGGGDRRSPVWMTGPVDVRRTPRTLVVAADGAPDVDTIAQVVRRAVPVVLGVLPRWRDGVVVEAPGSVEALHQALDGDPGTYDAIAAVTTTVDGSLAPDAPVHVFVNPRVFAGLRPNGAQVVMSHEVVHVATDAATSSMPLWLLEGFADYVALREVALPITTTAGQIIRQVRRQGPPGHLPGPDEFDTTATRLGASYEAAWLACRLLAQIGGQAGLVRFYDGVDGGESVDAALEAEFGIDQRELTRRWRSYLTEIAG